MASSENIVAASRGFPVGVGLKAQHYDHVLSAKPALAFFEVHAENYMMPGGAHHRYLEAIAVDYKLSFHGVGMSLGSADGLQVDHLKGFKGLVERYRPWLVSEHLAWSRSGDIYLNDLLPIPLTTEGLAIVSDNVSRMQDAIGRKILIENPSSYIGFTSSSLTEVEFLEALAGRTGCGILLDVNNVYVSGKNMGWDAATYLDAVPAGLVGEIHLAGHTLREVEGRVVRIDDHGSRVCEDVWPLYERLLARIGPRPTLVEWDTNLPDFSVLEAEAQAAASIMGNLFQNQEKAGNG